MYLRTPKRYTRGQRRSPISLRWLWLWLLTPVVAFVGIQIYQNREVIGPPIHQALYSMVNNAQSGLATAVAPTALPTPDPSERLLRADENWSSGRIEAAIADYQSVLGAVPNDVQPHYRVTLGLLMQGRLEEGLAAAEQTVTADPFSADAWAIRSMAMDWNSRYGEAIASGLRALELNPNSARAMAILAQAYLDNGQTELARSTAENALDIDPNSYEAYRVRAQIYQTVDYDFAAAKADYEQAYQLAPNMPQQVIDMALITASDPSAPDYETAIGMLQDIGELNPQNARVLYWLGYYFYRGQGDPNQALDYLARCADINPKSILCNALLGRVQMALGDNIAAVESLRKAIDLGSTDAYYHLWLGRAYIGTGSCPSAVPYLQQAYDYALDSGLSDVETAAAEDLAECQAPIPGVEITPEATVEAEA
jgi:tetratricopeptide (TPR) repeat protein